MLCAWRVFLSVWLLAMLAWLGFVCAKGAGMASVVTATVIIPMAAWGVWYA